MLMLISFDSEKWMNCQGYQIQEKFKIY